MKPNTYRIIILSLLLLSLAFAGCDTVTNATIDEVRTPTGEVITGDGVNVTDLPDGLQEVALSNGYSATDVIFLNEMSEPAQSQVLAQIPDKVTTKTRVLYKVEYKPKAAVQAGVQATGMIPVPGANFIPIALNGILGIAAIFLQRQKSKARAALSIQDKAVQTFATVDDTLQDVMDQLGKSNPELVNRYYEIREQAIEKVGMANGVLLEVQRVISDNATPTKTI